MKNQGKLYYLFEKQQTHLNFAPPLHYTMGIEFVMRG